MIHTGQKMSKHVDVNRDSVVDDLEKERYSNIKKPRKNLTCQQCCKRIVIGLLICVMVTLCVIACLILIAWFSLGAYLWQFAFAVNIHADCDEFRGNSPSNFTINNVCTPLVGSYSDWTVKLAPYFVDANKTEVVTFKSKDPEWIATGKFSVFTMVDLSVKDMETLQVLCTDKM